MHEAGQGSGDAQVADVDAEEDDRRSAREQQQPSLLGLLLLAKGANHALDGGVDARRVKGGDRLVGRVVGGRDDERRTRERHERDHRLSGRHLEGRLGEAAQEEGAISTLRIRETADQ